MNLKEKYILKDSDAEWSRTSGVWSQHRELTAQVMMNSSIIAVFYEMFNSRDGASNRDR